jgi:glycosyltransferase involved in cell wall biosynthesis/GT2 family glycosyltransferase
LRYKTADPSREAGTPWTAAAPIRRHAALLRGMLRISPPGTSLGLERGAVAVCIPVHGAYDDFAQCLDSVLRHTPVRIPLLVADDASPDPAVQELLERRDADGALAHEIHYARQAVNVGFVNNCNDAIAAVAPADIVLLNSDCIVGPEWLERLRDAAYADSTVATATPFTNHGTILSIPYRNRPTRTLPEGCSVDDVAVSLQRLSRRIRPHIPAAVGHCIYIRRTAVDLAGAFDPAFSPGYGEEVDFSQRCLLQGLVHVAADDVFVYHRGSASFGLAPHKERNDELVEKRYPYYQGAVAAAQRDTSGPLPRALALGRVAMRGLRVTVDARCLGPHITGTQVHTLELIAALARTDRVRLRAVVPRQIGEMAAETLATVEGVQTVVEGEELEPDDLVHRPYQLLEPGELRLLPQLGERLLITHQDMIAYRNPGYFASSDAWRQFRSLTSRAFGLADHICFFSQHAANDAAAEQLIDPSRTSVVYIGADHHTVTLVTSPQQPPAAAQLDGKSFLLCIGTDFRHKNRVFALRILSELHRRHGWDGTLVFAGPEVSEGSSRPQEAAFLRRHPGLADRVLDLRNVSEPEKAWLFEHCAGVVYPSAYEGFGLIPFEAAAYGAPCFFAWQTALAETLPESSATIVPWDEGATADAIFAVLADEQRRAELVASVAEAGTRFTWERTAAELVDLYEHVITTPRRDVTALADDAYALVNGVANSELLALPTEVANALLAFTLRPWLREPLFWALKAGHRVGHTMRRVRRDTEDERDELRSPNGTITSRQSSP